MMKRSLNDLLEHEIKDLYSAETQLVTAMPDMINACSNENLRKAFRNHLEETKDQKARLEKIAGSLEINPRGETCNAMKGLIEECREMINMDADKDVRDAGLIACAQRIEHYEIAGYGSARHFASRLHKEQVANLLEKTLEEEKNADQHLNKLAKQDINEKAMAV